METYIDKNVLGILSEMKEVPDMSHLVGKGCPSCKSLRARIEAAEAYIEAMEEYDAADAQPELWKDQESYAEDMDSLMRKMRNSREAWERAKENGKS